MKCSHVHPHLLKNVKGICILCNSLLLLQQTNILKHQFSSTRGFPRDIIIHNQNNDEYDISRDPHMILRGCVYYYGNSSV